MLLLLIMSTSTQSAVLKIKQEGNSHQVVFKRIGNYATDVHFHHIRIPVNLSKVIETPTKAMETIKTYVTNVYQNSIMFYKDAHKTQSRSEPGTGNEQAHLAALLIKEQCEFVTNTSEGQLLAIQNNLLSVISTLPTSNTRPERQLELLFGIGATLFSLYNYINAKAEDPQIEKNKNSINSLTHIADIQENHLKHLDIEVANNRYFYLHQLKFNPALLVSASQDITFQTNAISDKFLSTIQQLQLKRLSPNFLQGETINKLFLHLQQKAHANNMDLLINAPSDLFQIDVSYFYKSHNMELNIFIHAPMVKPMKLLKFFQFIKFPLSQNIGKNLTMMPNVNEDLLAIGHEHQFKLLSQSDLNSCTQYGPTYMCKGRDVMRTDLDTTCLGAYYLENLEAIQQRCKFDLIPSQEHVFQIESNKWIISSPSDFSTTIKCPSTFQSITIRSSSVITVQPGCQVDLKSHVIQPDSATTDSDLETIHYEWSWDSNVLFPTYHTQEFEATIIHLKNITAISIENINAAVASALANSKASNKTVEEYFEDLESIRLSDSKPITSIDNVFITVLTFVAIATSYCLFKICFTPSHSIKPLFPSYRPREWTKMSRRRRKANKFSKEMTPIRHEKEIESNIPLRPISPIKTPVKSAGYHAVKF